MASHSAFENEAQKHRPGKDRYLSAKTFEVLPYIYGPKGRFLVDYYTYFRWMDDICDSPAAPKDERLEFLRRQERLVGGRHIDGPLAPIEEFYGSMPWGAIAAKVRPKVKEQFLILTAALVDDVKNYGLKARTRREIRQNNIRTLLPYAEVVALTLNERPVKPTKKFIDFIDSWNYVASLMHLHQDLEDELIVKIGFTENEKRSINGWKSVEERKAAIRQVFDKQRFEKEAALSLYGMFTLCSSLRELDITSLQKEISYRYMAIRQPLRLPKQMQKSAGLMYPSE